MSGLPLVSPGWHLERAGTVTRDAQRAKVRRAAEPVGPFEAHASYTTARQAARGQVAGWSVVIEAAAWPIKREDVLVAPDGTRYLVRAAVQRGGAPGGELGHVHVDVDVVS